MLACEGAGGRVLEARERTSIAWLAFGRLRIEAQSQQVVTHGCTGQRWQEMLRTRSG